MMVTDCMASFGKRLAPDQLWTEAETKSLFALGQQYAECVSVQPFEDVLGNIYQELASQYGKKLLGQYFTPAPVAQMLAKLQHQPAIFERQATVSASDPAVGSGVMLLQFLNVIAEDNPNHLERVFIHGIDLDRVCVRIATLQVLANNFFHQLNLRKLEMWHGNALDDPAKLQCYFSGATQGFLDAASQEQPENPTPSPDPQKNPKIRSKTNEDNGQMDLF